MKYLSRNDFIRAVHLEISKHDKSIFFSSSNFQSYRFVTNTAAQNSLRLVLAQEYQPVLDLLEIYDKSDYWDDACQNILRWIRMEIKNLEMRRTINEYSSNETYDKLKDGRIFVRCCNVRTLRSSLFAKDIPYEKALDSLEDIVFSLVLLGSGRTILARGNWVSPITNDDLSKWDVSFPDALSYALKNNKTVLKPKIALVTDTTSKRTNNKLLNLYSIGNRIDNLVSSAVFYEDFLKDFAWSYNLPEAYLIVFEDHVILFSAKGIGKNEACKITKQYIEANREKGGADAICPEPLFYSKETNKITLR